MMIKCFIVCQIIVLRSLRTWKIVDWCNYDPQRSKLLLYKSSKNRNITILSAPTFHIMSTIKLLNLKMADCEESGHIYSAEATDDCTIEDLLEVFIYYRCR